MNKIKDINNSIKLKNEVIDKNEILHSESNKDIYL